jgi:hypothetical protein
MFHSTIGESAASDLAGSSGGGRPTPEMPLGITTSAGADGAKPSKRWSGATSTGVLSMLIGIASAGSASRTPLGVAGSATS